MRKLQMQMLGGGADVVSSLINKDLIDELYLFINPTALCY